MPRSSRRSRAYGEVAVGLGLVLGLLTGLPALAGLFLSLNFGLATQWMSFGQQGFHLLLVTSMIIFLCARAGRVWGLDARILSRAGKRGWLRLIMWPGARAAGRCCAGSPAPPSAPCSPR